MTKLSIIIPSLNEEDNPYFRRNLETFSALDQVEVIISDGGSSDATYAICRKAGALLLQNKTSSRAQRINFGMQVATGDIILLAHPRSLVHVNNIECLLRHSDTITWGGFTHSFDEKHFFLKWTSWYSNYVRGAIFGILYLDHCIFFNRTNMEDIYLPPVDIFEDTILSQKLRSMLGRPTILSNKVTTSAVRFKTNGIYRQSIINQYLKLNFFLGRDHRKMNQYYESKVSLNADYSNS